MDTSNWRSQLQADLRKRALNRIMDAMKSHHIQVSGNEGQQELRKIAVSFEKEVYITATTQSDYMRKICFKILSSEARPQNPMSDAYNINTSDRGKHIPGLTEVHSIGNSSNEYDWRDQLHTDSRQRIVNKIIDTLKRHVPFTGHDWLHELENIAVSLEDKIYNVATSQSDYLRKISLKMLTMETRSQNPMPDAMHSNSGASSAGPTVL